MKRACNSRLCTKLNKVIDSIHNPYETKQKITLQKFDKQSSLHCQTNSNFEDQNIFENVFL